MMNLPPNYFMGQNGANMGSIVANQMLNSMLMSNPQARQILDELKQSGCTPKDFFYRKAEEMGVNPQDILKQIM